jgi:hypothetical protein
MYSHQFAALTAAAPPPFLYLSIMWPGGGGLLEHKLATPVGGDEGERDVRERERDRICTVEG